jgi:hypothetical protein
MINSTMIRAGLALALMFGGSVWAAEGGTVWIGGGLGSSSADDSFSDGAAVFDVDDDDFLFRLQLGVDVNEWLSVHGGWADFGGYDSRLSFMAAGATGETEVDGIYGGVSLHREIGHDHWFVQGLVGIMAWDIEFEGAGFTGEDNGSEPYYGFGVGKRIGTQWMVSADYIRYELDQIDLDTIGVTLMWAPGGFVNP